MHVNFEQPITTYELIAIILSVLALVIPAAKWVLTNSSKDQELIFSLLG